MTRQLWCGWKLDRDEREALLGRHPPRYARPVADHVTFGPAGESEDMPRASSARIVGRADDGEGVEAMVVAIDGSTDRPTGGTYHVTWSLAPGREARESNEVIAARGWQPLERGDERFRLTAARWPY